jgi:hypothetical protein
METTAVISDVPTHYAVNLNGARVACFKSLERAKKWMARHDPAIYRIITAAEWWKH